MAKVTLGVTRIKVTPIGIGTGYIFGRKTNTNNVTKIIQKAVDLGINFIDTAEDYGKGKAEEMIGKALIKNRKNIIIATKFSPENSDKKNLTKSLDMSLKRLRSDYIDLYQFHWPSPKIELAQTISVLNSFIKRGKVRYIGLGNFSKTEIQKSLKMSKQIVSLQSEYNLFERTVEDLNVLKYCQSKKLSLIAYSPLDQGRIRSMNRKQLNFFEYLSKKYNKTFAQLMLNWLISHRGVIAIPKTLKLDHLVQNFDSMKFEIERVDVKRINKMFQSKLLHVPINSIRVSEYGEWGHKVYKSLNEAVKNNLNFTPSPMELSDSVKIGGFLKPVRLIKVKRKGQIEYDLIGGRIRYWAWVIAYGNKKSIPAYIREI